MESKLEKLEERLEAKLESKLGVLPELVKKIDALEKENLQLKKEINIMSSRMEIIDRKTRSTNIVINGLESTDITAAKTKFSELCSGVLNVNVPCSNVAKLSRNFQFQFGCHLCSRNYYVCQIQTHE